MPLLRRGLAARRPNRRGRGTTDRAAPEADSELLDLLRQGRKIEAIKLRRERTGAGLKEAKDAVEALAARHGLPAKGTGCLGMALLAITASAAVVMSL